MTPMAHHVYEALEVEVEAGPLVRHALASSPSHCKSASRDEAVSGTPADCQQANTRLPHSRLYTLAWSVLGLLMLACATTAIAMTLVTPAHAAAAAAPAGATPVRSGAGVDYGTLLKPAFHISPEPGPNGSWLNDPNGMFQLNGLTHVFYQLNPSAPVWGSPYWGHVVSRNLAHWRRLPIALAPDQPFDSDGVFSGSATIVDGVPTMLYTGVLNFTQYGYYYQLQALAVPAPGGDPYYVMWDKPAGGNPLALSLPPGGSHDQFRDPTTAWRAGSLEQAFATPSAGAAPLGAAAAAAAAAGADELWYVAIGALVDCVGSAALYSSPDLRTWTYNGTLFSQLRQNADAHGECLAPESNRRDVPPGGAPPPAGGTCDRFGPGCHMWECPDYFAVAQGVLAFKYSSPNDDRQPLGGDWYVLGSTAPLNHTGAPAQGGADDTFSGRLDGRPYPARLVDYGSVYASKTFLLEDGRRVWLGWVYEDSLGCRDVCGDGTDFIRELGWQGVQSLPRLVSYDALSQSLVFTPLPELQQLRLGLIYTGILTLNLTGLEEVDRGMRPGGDGQEEDTLFAGAAAPATSGIARCSRKGSTGLQAWLQQVQSAHVASADLVPRQVALDAAAAAAAAAADAGLTAAGPGRDHACVLGRPRPAAAGTRGLPLCAGGLRRQLEVLAQFSLLLPLQPDSGAPDGAGGSFSFVVGFQLLTGNSTSTAVFLNGTAEMGSTDAAGATLQVTRLDLSVDKSRSGGMTSACVQGGPVDLPPGGVPASHLTLHAYIDRSVVEVFALQGHGRVTARIYPLVHDAAWGLRAFGAVGAGRTVAPPLVTAEVDVYELDQCWRDEV